MPSPDRILLFCTDIGLKKTIPGLIQTEIFIATTWRDTYDLCRHHAISALIYVQDLPLRQVYQRLKQVINKTHIILIGDYFTPLQVFYALQAGARGIICKDQISYTLLPCIEAVLHRRIYHMCLEPSNALTTLKWFVARGTLNAIDIPVLCLIVQGNNNAQIAAQLGISTRSVIRSKHNLRHALNIDNNQQIITAIERQGWSNTLKQLRKF